MSSWFTNLANSLTNDDEDDEEHEEIKKKNNEIHQRKEKEEEEESINRDKEEEENDQIIEGRGVKEDLSELTKTLTRQLWGVASFLAPPPQSQSQSTSFSDHSQPIPSPPPPPPPPPRSHSISDWNRWDSTDNLSVTADISDHEISDQDRITGIRNDFKEIGGRFKSEISKLSNHKAVNELSKIASNFLPFGSEEDLIGNAVGVTKEVLAFARNIAMHPETWLDFPLADDEDSDDFDMSDAQQEHALAVERLAPRLAALRIELCPGYMSEGCFWKIYFVLLHPRLNKHDAELLSTPQIVEARAMLTQDLQNRTKTQETSFPRDSPRSLQEDHYTSLTYVPSENTPLKTFVCDTSRPTDVETEKHPIVSTEMQMIDKSVVDEEPVAQKNKDILVSSSSKFLDQKYEEDGDDWLEDEGSEIMGTFTGTNVPLGDDEDVSFSDLEDDDDKSVPTSLKAVAHSSNPSSDKESRDWVQLNKSSTDTKGDLSERPISEPSRANDHDNKDTNDWLNVDDIDVI
ncbi:hypothetical protein AQUCO_06000075v1 [Aquilegia coerulea]|uniref:BSD domain-containing protein n=1 Tax=Aquilegia coerulea TaxID=218851 RepID=A0A2G5CDX7_AQUCA|nr:hypothetical protein AQUCO_06000075v1 [Aquilegia coerulea]